MCRFSSRQFRTGHTQFAYDRTCNVSQFRTGHTQFAYGVHLMSVNM
jgi:hypothetical protein